MILRLIFPRNVYDDEDDIADSHKHISATDSWNTFLIKRAVPSRASGELRNACHVAFGGGCLGGQAILYCWSMKRGARSGQRCTRK